MVNETFREPTQWERGLFERLVEGSFPGRDEIAEQLSTSLVRSVDQDGCLEFRLRSEIKAPVVQSVPIEAEAGAEGENVVHALLHVREGKITELEIYTNTGDPILPLPAPSEWRVILLPPPKV
jgi:ketosteroid isomerase-like protein